MFNFDKLKRLIAENGVSASYLCDKVGKKNYYIRDLKKNGTAVPLDIVNKWATILHTTPAYLLDETDDPSVPSAPFGFAPVPELSRLPIVGNIACGEPILAEQNIQAYMPVPAEWRADFILHCHGDSMYPKVQDGDFVAVRIQPDVEDNEIAAVRIGTEATLKKVMHVGDVTILNPVNTSYEPIVLSPKGNEDIRIEGKAVGFFRAL